MIALIVYTWTLLRFFWQLPSWLYFLNAGEILASLAYLLVVNFGESLAVMGGLLLLAVVLPKKWFRDVFVARGASLSIAGLAYMAFLGQQFNNDNAYPTLSLPAWTVLLAAVLIAMLVYLFGQVSVLRRILEGLADRASIFAYILAPLSVISMLVVAFRALVG